MRTRLACLSFVAALSCPWAEATTQLVNLSALNSSTTLATVFGGNESLLVNTLVTGATGALGNTVVFNVGAGVTSFTGAAAWEIGTATGLDPRLIGVNIDIFDASNALVASDAFSGVSNGFAVSTFEGSIAPGTYRAVVTGTGVRTSSLDLSLTFAGTPSNAPPPAPAGFLQQSSTVAAPIGAGDTVLIDSAVIGRTGALRQAVTFTAGAGVTGFTSNAAWEITTASGFGPRLIGVNIDLLDADDNLVFSDNFGGVLGNSFALSSFAGALTPGTYTLVATGTAVRDVMFDVSLTLTGDRVAAVPEPATYALMLAGFGALAWVGQRRQRPVG